MTLSFLVTTVTGVLGAYGLVKQAKKIFGNKSGASVSVSYFMFSTTLFVSFLFFGLEKNSLAMLIQSTFRVPFMSAILIGLFLYKGYGRLDWIMFVGCALLVVWMFKSGTVGLHFFTLNFIAAYFVGHQAWEIYKNKSRGQVDLFFLIVFTSSAVFWTVYGFLIDEWKIWAACLLLTILYSSVLACWIAYPADNNQRKQ
jgi:uncharacterized protein with PQ loop repeat